MADSEEVKSTGGVAPFGYGWQGGKLIINEAEAPVRKLIYELFLKHRRKKTIAKLLNDLGYRTRNGSLFSDTTIDRLLRDTTAKGIRIVDGREIKVEAIISNEVWERANNLLGIKQTRQAVQLFAGFAFCSCGGKMIVPGNLDKYVCLDCRHKILIDDLEEIFAVQLAGFPLESGNDSDIHLSEYWIDLSSKEKRIVIEQICAKIIVGKTEIQIEFAFNPNSLKTAAFGQHSEQGNETPKLVSAPSNQEQSAPVPTEPLINEIEAAKFLGISRMTLLRKRNAREIGFYRVGFRVLYSKEKHLLPFLKSCEK
jgi:site-specific DNA recombinase